MQRAVPYVAALQPENCGTGLRLLSKACLASSHPASDNLSPSRFRRTLVSGIRLRRSARAAWDVYYGSYKTVILGLGGSTVEELTYRLLSGHEQLWRNPRVIILLIGGRGALTASAAVCFRMSWQEAAQLT